jgi:hypothetical protein
MVSVDTLSRDTIRLMVNEVYLIAFVLNSTKNFWSTLQPGEAEYTTSSDTDLERTKRGRKFISNRI